MPLLVCLTFYSGIFPDPRERLKEDDLDVVLSPQRRSFGGGCHVTAAVSSRRSGSPLEKDHDGLRLIGGRRIGSGRIISARNFEKDHRLSDKDLRDLRDRDRERDYKDKRFRVCLLGYLVLRVLRGSVVISFIPDCFEILDECSLFFSQIERGIESWMGAEGLQV